MSAIRRGPRSRRLGPELVGRQLLESERAPDRVTDRAYLRGLAQRLGAGEDVVAIRVPVVEQHARGHRRDIALVDRGRLGGAVRPTHHVAARDLRPPPVPRVRREHPRPQDRHIETCLREQAFDLDMKAAHRIRLLEERVRRAVRRREQDDAPRLGRRVRRERAR